QLTPDFVKVLEDGVITNLTNVVSIAAGAENCALLVDSTVRCWGLGTTTASLVTEDGLPLTGVVSLSAGPGGRACGVLSNGTVSWESIRPPTAYYLLQLSCRLRWV